MTSLDLMLLMQLAASGITPKTVERLACPVRNHQPGLNFILANIRAISLDTQALVRRSAVRDTNNCEAATSNRPCCIVRLFRLSVRSGYAFTCLYAVFNFSTNVFRHLQATLMKCAYDRLRSRHSLSHMLGASTLRLAFNSIPK